MNGTLDLRDLYQGAILEHGRHPRNRRATGGCARRGHAENPLCGDEVTVGLDIEEGVIRGAAFDGQCCIVATASASLMTEVLVGRTPAQARELLERVRAVVAGGPAAPSGATDPEPRLAVLSCVRNHPERVQCATLAWQAMRGALDGPPS